MTSFGHGPWFVALIEDSSHPGATEIFIHTYPENVVHVKNLQLCQQWFIHFYVGPFSHLQHCLSYCNQWNKSKQLKTRIDQGQKLFNEQKTKQNLYMLQGGSSGGDRRYSRHIQKGKLRIHNHRTN